MAVLTLFAAGQLAPQIQRAIAPTVVSRDQGFAFVTPVPKALHFPLHVQGAASGVKASGALLLFEDDFPLGPSDAQHADIRNKGEGLYSHWNRHLHFSSSDGTDPRANGRVYSYRVQSALRPTALRLALLLATLGVLGLAAHGARQRMSAATAPQAGGRERSAKQIGVALMALSVIGLAVLGLIAATNAPLEGTLNASLIKHARLLGYMAPIEADLRWPLRAAARDSGTPGSALTIAENGEQMGRYETDPRELRNQGAGRYGFYGDRLAFSTPDGADPRTNGRTYTWKLPVEVDPAAWALLLAIVATGILLVFRASLLPGSRAAVTALFKKRPVAIVAALFALELLCLLALAWRPTIERTIEPHAIGHSIGESYVVSLSRFAPRGYRLLGDEENDPSRSDLVLLKDLSPIGQPHTAHDEIARKGQGGYSHWHDVLYFSTPQNTDPRLDGNRYSLKATLTLGPLLAGVLYVAVAFITFAFLTVLRRTLFVPGMQRTLGVLVTTGATVAAIFRGSRGRVLALLVVSAAAATAVTANWREYYITPDSHSYLPNQFTEPEALRPPGVSTWLSLFSDRSSLKNHMDEIVGLNGVNKLQVGSEDDPLLPAIQAQRLFLLIAFATVAFVLMNRMSSLGAMLGIGATAVAVSYAPMPIVRAVLVLLCLFAIFPLISRFSAQTGRTAESLSDTVSRAARRELFVLLSRAVAVVAAVHFFLAPILKHSFLSEQQQFLMSEALASSWQLLFTACALRFIWKPNALTLIGAGVFAAFAYLTRSASVFLLLVLAFLLLLALFHDFRRSIGPVLGAIAVAAVVINAVPISQAVRGESPAPSAPLLNWGPIAFALEVAQRGDERLLPDSESKRFLEKALDIRDGASSKREVAPAYRSINLGANLFFVAHPAAKQTLSHVSSWNVSELFGKVAWPILTLRATDYGSIIGESVLVATGLHPNASTTRLFESLWHWLALISLVALAVWGTERDVKIAMAATLLIGMHLTHVVIVSAFDAPLGRYIFATEIFVVFAIVLLVDYHIRVLLKAGLKDWFKVARHASVDDTNSRKHITE